MRRNARWSSHDARSPLPLSPLSLPRPNKERLAVRAGASCPYILCNALRASILPPTLSNNQAVWGRAGSGRHGKVVKIVGACGACRTVCLLLYEWVHITSVSRIFSIHFGCPAPVGCRIVVKCGLRSQRMLHTSHVCRAATDGMVRMHWAMWRRSGRNRKWEKKGWCKCRATSLF